MEGIKGLHGGTIHDYDNNQRKGISITTDESKCVSKKIVSTFEDLANELLYTIFDFLDFYYAFESFYDLNQRFQNIFLRSNSSIKINISSISKSRFHHYTTHIIIPHTNRIKVLRLSNPFTTDIYLSLFPVMSNFTRLKTLIINHIECDYIEHVVNHLSSLPVLSSLIITSINNIKNQNNIYQKIFSLSALKYCQMSLETSQNLHSLPEATNQFSPIEHLIIKNKVLLGQINSLVSYVPQLRRLSLGHLNGYGNNRAHTPVSITLNYLTHVSLEMHSVSFNAFELLIEDLFHQALRMKISCRRDSGYLNANQWERLISTYMPNLYIFDFQYKCCLCDYNDDRQLYEASINQFDSSFWINKQWFFEHQYYQTVHLDCAIFYSTYPYRRKHYILYGQPHKHICPHSLKSNEDLVDHLHIYSESVIEQVTGHFSNVTELTLCDTFDVPCHLDLNHLISVNQISKLILNCRRFSFEQLIELLYFTHKLHTLELSSVVFYQTDDLSIRLDEKFRLVSKTNTITNVILHEKNTFSKIQLIPSLFPRLEYLTINLYENDSESTARYLLSKFNKNTHSLVLLCIGGQCKDSIERLNSMITSEKLCHDYTMKIIDQKLYLWW